MAQLLYVITHPLVQHKLTLLRDKTTPSGQFRRLLKEISTLLGYEVTRDLPVTSRRIETPLETMDSPVIDGKKIVIASILRAGNGILDGMLEILPSARVGHIGLYRDPVTHAAVEYYFRMPEHTEERDVIVVAPLIATGNAAIAAVSGIKALNPRSIKFLCIIASPEGLRTVYEEHPEVPVYLAAVDRGLNDKAYIVPGIGDAGDRLYATKASESALYE